MANADRERPDRSGGDLLTMEAVELSVVVPVYNEVAILAELLGRIQKSCAASGRTFEVVVVDDASTDGTTEFLRNVHDGVKIRVVFNSTNLGQFRSAQSGLLASKGRYVISLDGDLQDPPELIPKLAASIPDLEDDHDVVFAVKSDHERNERWWFLAGKSLFNLAIILLGSSMPKGAGSYVLISRALASKVLAVSVGNVNLAPILIALGAKPQTVSYVKGARYDATSRVGFRRLVVEGLTSLWVLCPWGHRFL